MTLLGYMSANLLVQDYYGADDTSSYAAVLRKGIELVRKVGEMVPFEATSVIKYTDVWKFLEKLGTGEAESPLPCKIEYGPVTRGSMAMTVRSLKKADDEPSKVLLLYRDEGVHGRVPEITFDMAVLIVQLLVTMVLAVMDENDDEMRAVVIGKMRELDELVLEEDLALVLIGRRAGPLRVPIHDPKKGDAVDDVDGEADEITIDYGNELDPDAIVKDLLKATGLLGVLKTAQGINEEFTKLIDQMTTDASEEAEKFRTIYLELKNLLADGTSAGGGGGGRKKRAQGGRGTHKKSKFRRAMRSVMYGGDGEEGEAAERANESRPDDDAQLQPGSMEKTSTEKEPTNTSQKSIEEHKQTFAAMIAAINSATSGTDSLKEKDYVVNKIEDVPAVRGRLIMAIKRIATKLARGVFERSLNTLCNLSDFSTMAMAIRPKSKDDDSLTLKMPPGYQSDGKLVQLFEELPKDVARIDGQSITLRGIHKAASDMVLMPNLKITKPVTDEDGAMESWALLRDMELMPAVPMTIDDFANKTRGGSIGAQPLQNIMILMSAVQSKLEEISNPLTMAIVILMCMTDNRRIINERLVSKRLLTFVKLNYIERSSLFRGDKSPSEIVPSLFSEIRSDWVKSKSTMLQMQHIAHPKPYIFGPFNSVIHKLVPREATGKDWTTNQGMFDAVSAGNDVVILGYGASGAGKTSFLVAMTGGKRKDVDSTGVFSYILKFISEKLGVSQFTLDVHQAMSKDVFTQSATAIGSKDMKCTDDVNKNCNVPTGSTQTYVLKDKVLQQDQISAVETFLEVKVTEPAFRETWATVNNPNSSRTHAIVRVEFGATDEERAKYGRILLGDLAGYENHFDCRLSSMPGFNMAMYMSMYNESAKVRASANQPQSIWQIEEVLERRKGGEDPGVNFYLPKWDSGKEGLVDQNRNVMTGPDGMWTQKLTAGGGVDDGKPKAPMAAVKGQPSKSNRDNFAFNKAESSTQRFANVVYDKDFAERNVLQKIADEFNKEYGLKVEDNDNFATPDNLAKLMRNKISTYYPFNTDNTLPGGKPVTKKLDKFITLDLDDLFKQATLGFEVAKEMDTLPAVLAGDSDQIIHPRGGNGEMFKIPTELDLFFNKIIYGGTPSGADDAKRLGAILTGTKILDKDDRDTGKNLAQLDADQNTKLGNAKNLRGEKLVFVHGEGGAKKYANASVNPGVFWEKMCEIQGKVKVWAGGSQSSVVAVNKLKNYLFEHADKQRYIDFAWNALRGWFEEVTGGTVGSGPLRTWNTEPITFNATNISMTIGFFVKLEAAREVVADIIKDNPGQLFGKDDITALEAMMPAAIIDLDGSEKFVAKLDENGEFDRKQLGTTSTASLETVVQKWFANNTATGDKRDPKAPPDYTTPWSMAASFVLMNEQGVQAIKDKKNLVCVNDDLKTLFHVGNTPPTQVLLFTHGGKFYAGKEIFNLLDAVGTRNEMTDYKQIPVYPDGLYFFLRTLSAEKLAKKVDIQQEQFPPLPDDITGVLFDNTFNAIHGTPVVPAGAIADPVDYFNKFNEAAKYSMLLYLNIWRLKGEVLAKSLVLSEHCLDRDVEATFIIGTLDQLAAFVRTAIFDKTGVAYPPIHVSCLGQMLKSARYEASKPTTLEKLVKLETLNWLGLAGDGKLRGEFVFCLAAVVNIADIPTSQQQSLNKYVDVSDVKAAVYNKDPAALIAALEDLVGWRATRVDERADPVRKESKSDGTTVAGGAIDGSFTGGASMADIDTPPFPPATGRIVRRMRRPFETRPWEWGGKINWDAQEEPYKLMAPLREAVQSIRDKLPSGGTPKPTEAWPEAPGLTAKDVEISAYNDTVAKLTAPWKAYDETMLMQKDELKTNMDTNGELKKSLVAIASPTFFSDAMRFCEYVDNDNESTAMGVMAFMDKMSKFGKTNTVCHVDAWDANFVLDQKQPWLVDGDAQDPYANSGNTGVKPAPLQRPPSGDE